MATTADRKLLIDGEWIETGAGRHPAARSDALAGPGCEATEIYSTLADI
jgi:hypothetical protein